MFCQNCGTKNNDASVFCENCGAKLEKPVQQAQPIQQAQPVQQAQPIRPAQPRKPISKIMIAVAAEAVLLIAAIVVFFNIGGKVYGPEKVAEKFFVEVANHNFKEAYKALDIEEDDFINEKNFENAGCNQELSKVTNYRIKKSRKKDLGKDVEITYRTKGSSSDRSYNISVSKKPNKKALFFDNWEVSPESMIVEDFSVYIPAEAEVTVDGVKLGKDYLNKKYSDDTSSCYIIPKLFVGEHQIVVTQEGMQEVRKLVDAYDYSFSVYSMSPDEKILKEVANTATEDFKAIYTAAAAGKDFDTVADLFSAEDDRQEDAREAYEDLVAELTESEYSVINHMAFSNIEATACEGYLDGDETCMAVKLEFDYAIDYTENWFGEVTTDSNEDYSSMYMSFVYEDGKWLLVELNTAYLYY